MRVLLFVFLLFSFSYGNTNKNILILNSYHQSMPWVQQINDSIFKELNNLEYKSNIYIENMDTKRIFNEDYLQALYKVYIQKYENIEFDLIIVSDDNAFNFIKKYRNDIFGEVPTLFTGVNNFKVSDLDGLKHYSGVIESIDLKGTIRLIKKFLPKTKIVYIVNDYLESGKNIRDRIKNDLSTFEHNLEIRYSKNKTFYEIRDTIRKLPENSVVLLGAFFQGKEGKYFETYQEVGVALTKNLDIPIFSLYDFYLNGNVVGGKVLSGKFQGEAVAKLATQFLKQNIAVEFIPVQKKDGSKIIIDYLAFEKLNIVDNVLSSDYIILNKPIGFYEKHKELIIPFVIILFFLLIIVAILLYKLKWYEISNSSLKKHNILLEGNLDEFKEIVKTQEDKLFELSKMSERGKDITNIAQEWRKPLSIISTSATGLKIQKEHKLLNEELLLKELDVILENTEDLSKTIESFRNN